MINVGRNDRASSGYFRAYEFGRHILRYRCSKRLTFVLMQQRVTRSVADVPGCFAPKVFADRDELHFRSDNAATCVVELGDTGAWLSSQHRTTHQWKVFQLADVLHTRAIGRVE